MLSHLLGQDTHADAGKVVDGEPDVARVLHGEDAMEARPESFVGQARPQLGQPGFLQDVLEQDLDEDAATGCGFIFVEADDAEAVPAQSIGRKHVTKQHGNVAQLVVLVSVDGLVVLCKGLLEEIAPQTVDLGEALANHAKELGVSLFLGATLDNHGRQLGLLAFGQIDLHQLVDCFFRVGARHDGEVDGPSEVDQVGVGLVLDLHGL